MNVLTSLKSLVAIDTTGPQLTDQLHERAKDAASKRDQYAADMAQATEQDVIFKYFLLVNLSAIETYVSTARLQSQSSFVLCKKVAYFSFMLIALGVGLGLWTVFKGDKDFDIAKLTGLAGVLTQLISGIFFYLYNKTLEQVNRFSDKLSSTQELALCFVANSNIDDDTIRDNSTAALARQLLAKQTLTNAPTADTASPEADPKR